MGMFGKTASGNAAASADGSDGSFFVGQKVSLKGTGKWWTGTYHATIVDIRAADETFKVQYPDGGFKRYGKLAFGDAQAIKGHDAAEGTDYGSEAFEWYHENYAPDVEGMSQNSEKLQDIRNQIAAATRVGDFQAAHTKTAEFRARQSHFIEGQHLKEELLAAVQSEDFLKAHEVKNKLDQFKKKDSNGIQISAAKLGGKNAAASSSAGAKSPSDEQPPFSEILAKAGKRALGGGMSGAAAMVVSVTTLMWMRTTMNYQYRYGTTTTAALRHLYRDGGVLRFYRGYGPALIQGPLSRFGDTAANAGVLALLDANPTTAGLPVGVKTIGASATAATWRIFLTPVDTVKTIMQVEGKQGLVLLRQKAKVNGFTTYYHGAMASAAATFAGHYPWFATYNILDEKVPKYDEKLKKLGRNAGIGFCASAVSDTISNSLRVIKTYRQTSSESISYAGTVAKVVEQDGWGGLFGRGLQTRIVANGMQAMMFSVMWKHFQEKLSKQGF